jgi:hypothetical protein
VKNEISLVKLATLPFILDIALSVYNACATSPDARVYWTGSVISVVGALVFTLPLDFMCLAVWFPHSNLLRQLGKIGSIIWLFYLLISVFLPESKPGITFLIVYCFLVICTGIVFRSLWEPEGQPWHLRFP